jgi:hypothetical protein
VTIFFTLSLTWMIEIKDHTIEIKSLLRKQTVHKDDISEIRFSQHDSGNTLVNYAVVIRLMDGKKITLQGVREGTPVLYNALRLWLDSKKIT